MFDQPRQAGRDSGLEQHGYKNRAADRAWIKPRQTGGKPQGKEQWYHRGGLGVQRGGCGDDGYDLEGGA